MPDIQNWDSGGTFDSGLQYDVNIGPSNGDIAPYLALVTSEHADKPNYIAMLSVFLQAMADIIANTQTIPALYDLDTAVGSQLDTIGLWVGQSRQITVPLAGVYFAFDTPGVGFDSGAWFGPTDTTIGLTSLSDEDYRWLLHVVIAANHWNGTIPGAYSVWVPAFEATGYQLVISDHQDMSMSIGLIPPSLPVNAVILGLLTHGYIKLRPMGVGITEYFVGSVAATPLFGFGAQGSGMAGFGIGCWPTIYAPA